MPNSVVAVVPAAGQGARMGSNIPKQYLTLGGIPILVSCLQVLQNVRDIEHIILAVPQSDHDLCWRDMVRPFGLHKVAQIVAGGARRQDSVRLGLMAVSTAPDIILVHDGVRPFIHEKMVVDVINGARKVGAAVAAIPIHDTVKRVGSDRMIRETVKRDELWQIQTPQAFRREWLMEGHRRAMEQNWEVTDDASLLERLGYPVAVVEGSRFNIKITRPEDLAFGEAIRQSTKQREPS